MICAAGIIAPGTTALAGLDRLAVDHGGAGRRLPSDPLLVSPDKEVVHVIRLRGALIAVPMTRTSVRFRERAAFVLNDRDGRKADLIAPLL